MTLSNGCTHCRWGALGRRLRIHTANRSRARSLKRSLVGKTFELRHSHFYGELYDENEFMLLAPLSISRCLSSCRLGRDNLSTPQNQRGVIPAGTRVRFRDVKTVNEWSCDEPYADFAEIPYLARGRVVRYPTSFPSEQAAFCAVILLSALDDAKVRKAAIERWLSPVRRDDSVARFSLNALRKPSL